MRRSLTISSLFILAACGADGPSTGDAAGGAPSPGLATSEDVAAMLTCLDTEGYTIVSAHRGGDAPGLPENTLELLQHSVNEVGVDLLEIDVRTSADGILYLFHDNELDQDTNGSGVADDQPWDDLRKLSLKDEEGNATPYRMPRLQDVLAWSDGKAILQLDIKRGTDYDDVAQAVRAAGAEDRVMPIAYSIGAALALNRRFPNSVISVPITAPADIERLVENGLDSERIFAWTGTDFANETLYEAIEARRVEVAFGTLGGRDSIDNQIEQSGDTSRYVQLAQQGVDIIATDAPAVAKAALVDAQLWPPANTCR